jgi:glycosyltransferase involved in cell wall biosynthesis
MKKLIKLQFRNPKVSVRLMRVLVIGSGYPTEKYKTIGIFAFDQAKALQSNGISVFYAFLDIRSIRRIRKFGYESKTIDNLNIFGLNIPVGKIPKFLLIKVHDFFMKKLLKKIKYLYGSFDIIHTHFINISYSVVKYKSIFNVPIICTEHSSTVNKDNLSKEDFNRFSFTYKNADFVIAVSKAFKARIEETYDVKVEYVPNIVNLKIFQLNHEKIFSDDSFSYVSVGNLVPNKGMDILIKAFHKSFKNDPKKKLFIIGKGPELKKLKNLIFQLSMENQISLLGFLSRDDIKKIFDRSNVFVLASYSETFGVAYIEAMASGLPVIGTHSGGPETFVSKFNGKLVFPGDISMLSNALESIEIDYSCYDSKQISNFISRNFSPEGISTRLIELYKDIVRSYHS